MTPKAGQRLKADLDALELASLPDEAGEDELARTGLQPMETTTKRSTVTPCREGDMPTVMMVKSPGSCNLG